MMIVGILYFQRFGWLFDFELVLLPLLVLSMVVLEVKTPATRFNPSVGAAAEESRWPRTRGVNR